MNLSEKPKTRQVVQLMRDENWSAAAEFGSNLVFAAVVNDKNWWWKHVDELPIDDILHFNAAGYGNLAMTILHGEKFVSRTDSIERLKYKLKQL